MGSWGWGAVSFLIYEAELTRSCLSVAVMLEAVCRRRTRNVQCFDSLAPPTGLDYTHTGSHPTRTGPWKLVESERSGLIELLDLNTG